MVTTISHQRSAIHSSPSPRCGERVGVRGLPPAEPQRHAPSPLPLSPEDGGEGEAVWGVHVHGDLWPTPYSVPSRSGVVLIVVLGMLAVLALIGVAFTTFSGQEEQSSGRYQAAFQNPRVDMAPDQLFLEALSQLIADTNNPLSALRGHGLLSDMYGPGSDYGVGPDGRPGVATVDDDGNGMVDDVGELGFLGSDDRNGLLDAIEWYAGAFSGSGDRGLYQPVDPGPDGTLGTFDDCFDLNFVWNDRTPNPTLPHPTRGDLAGGFNEDYDYPDRQNMFMALLRADGTVLVSSFLRPGAGAPTDSDLSAPLVVRTAPPTAGEPDQRARLKLLRPRGGFTDLGSSPNGLYDAGEPATENPYFPVFNPQVLDVDNNGDGIPDSIWIDLGFPVQQTANGRRFRPLFAFLVVDGDGKLNLNAHGNVANSLQSPPGHADQDASGNVLGQGYSPGEVALVNIFKDATQVPAHVLQPGVLPNEYSWLLTGRPAGVGLPTPVAGRYGETTLIGSSTPPRAGQTNTDTTPPSAAVPPTVGDDDSPATLGNPPYWSSAQRGNWSEGLRGVFVGFVPSAPKTGRYGTPADFNGDGALGVDSYGRFIYFAPAADMGWGGVAPQWPASMVLAGHSSNFDSVDDQAELDLYTSRANDGIFTPSDMEFLYRQFDVDSSSLFSRLRWLTPSLVPSPDTAAAARRRMMTTTESWDLIRYNMFPLTQGIGVAPAPNETELVFYRQRGSGKFNTVGLKGASTTATTPGLVPEPTTQKLLGLAPGLPVEIARGRRLNLNRGYFGTVLGGSPYYKSAVPHSSTPANSDPRTVARDIYILLRQLHSVDVSDTEAIRQMAQFAVNVVDFRDPDQIMTGFEYTIDLSLAGWDVDGDLETEETANRGLVWGVEAPQVVLNETYAIEDPTAVGMPQLWFELFNPQHLDATDNAFRADLRGPGSDSAFQVVLADTSPGVPGGGTPVGEPSTTARRLEFTAMPNAPAVGGTGTATLEPDNYLLVGPTTVAGNPLTPTPDFDVPESTFSPTAAEIGSTLRLYLRRLADPTNDHDPGPDTIDGTADDVNPYLTVDALDVQVYSEMQVSMTTHQSLERVAPYSVRRDFHSSGTASPHTLKAVNEKNVLPHRPLAFNDRPFASALELLFVPAVRPQWLTSTFVVPSAAVSPYLPSTNRTSPIRTGESGDVNPATPFLGAPYYLFGHMLNFLYETSGAAYPTPGLYRIFEFVEVPSRMAGSSDPAISQLWPIPTTGPDDADGRLDRVPGKMNINTAIAEQEQFLAMFNNHPLALDGTGSVTQQTGTAARPLPTPGNAATVPTELAFPCQSGTVQPTSELLKRCLDSMFGPDGIMGTSDDLPFRSLSVGTATIAAPQLIQPPDIHNTLLRSWSGPATRPTSTDLPLFLDSRGVAPPGGSGATNLLGYPNFQYQPLTKISNVAITRSNVYAVWVTVGFFEVPAVSSHDPTLAGDHPNRLANYGIANAPPELGREINADIGKNIRHRAFFVIDRSRARGYAGPPRSSAELQDVLGQVVIHSRIIE